MAANRGSCSAFKRRLSLIGSHCFIVRISQHDPMLQRDARLVRVVRVARVVRVRVNPKNQAC